MAEGRIDLTGNKNDEAKLRLDLVPFELIAGTARALTFGAKKYGDHNWRGGLKWSRVFAALLRHLFDWWIGVKKDADSGLCPLDHVAANLSFLMSYQTTQTGVDDRYKPVK